VFADHTDIGYRFLWLALFLKVWVETQDNPEIPATDNCFSDS